MADPNGAELLTISHPGLPCSTARSSDHPPACFPIHLTPFGSHMSDEHAGLPAMNDVAVCRRIDDQGLAFTRKISI
jgi:hypothetical protein